MQQSVPIVLRLRSPSSLQARFLLVSEFNLISKIKINSKPFVQLQVLVIVQYLEKFLFSIQKFDVAFYGFQMIQADRKYHIN